MTEQRKTWGGEGKHVGKIVHSSLGSRHESSKKKKKRLARPKESLSLSTADVVVGFLCRNRKCGRPWDGRMKIRTKEKNSGER